MASPNATYLITPKGKLVNFFGGATPSIDVDDYDINWGIGSAIERFTSRGDLLAYYLAIRDGMVTAGMTVDLRTGSGIPTLTSVTPNNVSHSVTTWVTLNVIGTNFATNYTGFFTISGVNYDAFNVAPTGLTQSLQIIPANIPVGVYTLVYTTLLGQVALVASLTITP